MQDHKKLASDFDPRTLAKETKNFSGAEIEGLVRAATSTAMNRLIKVREIKRVFRIFYHPPMKEAGRWCFQSRLSVCVFRRGRGVQCDHYPWCIVTHILAPRTFSNLLNLDLTWNPPPRPDMLDGWQVGGWHPTGMFSCYRSSFQDVLCVHASTWLDWIDCYFLMTLVYSIILFLG